MHSCSWAEEENVKLTWQLVVPSLKDLLYPQKFYHLGIGVQH